MNENKQDEYQPKKELDSQPLPEHIHDDSNGLDYTLVDGIYYLPDLLAGEDECELGVWAMRRLNFLKEFRHSVFVALKTSGVLNTYLSKTDREAEAMYDRLIVQMSKSESLTEELKLEDATAWFAFTNSIHNRAREIVNAEIIFA